MQINGLQTTLLVIHILSVAIWFGGIIALSYAGSALGGADYRVRRWFADAQLAVGRAVFSAAGILTLITGVWMVINNEFIEFSETYVSIGFLVVIVGTILGMAVYAPACKQLVSAIDSGDPAGEASASRKLMFTNSVNAVLLLVAVVAMVARW
ncbi:MAG: hypothetical protein M9942_04605 [Microthrixaceae bacterium]|nr:hypothetical protein [Microthrixaceae bacterium]MCO5317702.1 hypothetical protein [Microthrixaceae bacterium]